MLVLTSKERKTLLWISAIIIAGSILRFYLFNTKKTIVDSRQEVSFAGEVSVGIGKKSSRSACAPININTAQASELEKLPGIGSEIARRIVAYRETYGRFYILEDLEKVKGIGKKKSSSLRELISF